MFSIKLDASVTLVRNQLLWGRFSVFFVDPEMKAHK